MQVLSATFEGLKVYVGLQLTTTNYHKTMHQRKVLQLLAVHYLLYIRLYDIRDNIFIDNWLAAYSLSQVPL